MGYEEDFLMRQIKGASQLIAKLLQMKSDPLDIEFVQDEAGQLKPARNYLAQLIEAGKYDLASQYVASFKSKMTKEEYQKLVEWFLSGMEELDQARVVEFQEQLRG